MHLFDLPVELFLKILVHATLIRGVRRALRLKLVCKQFAQEVPPALFASRLLDSFSTEKILRDWYIENDHGATKFWHSYLVYRVLGESHHLHPRYAGIHKAAVSICQLTDSNMRATVEALCWPALQKATCPGIDRSPQPETPELDLLCASAYLNHLALAKRLLSQHVSPHSESKLFPSPMYLAAWAGNAQMLELFQAHVPELENFDRLRAFNPNWRGKVGPASIMGAARRGDLDMVRLAVYPPSRAAPGSTDVAGKPVESLRRNEDIGNRLSLAQGQTRELDVYQYLGSFFMEQDHHSALAKQAGLGNLHMVRYLLDNDADIRGWSHTRGNPLVEACRRCHDDVVDLLLARGADPNFNGEQFGICGDIAIVQAADSGNLPIVRKLLDHGANLKHTEADIEVGFLALNRAVLAEHTEMVKFFLSFGFDTPLYRQVAMESASQMGLDSMVELLDPEKKVLPVSEKVTVQERQR